MEFEVSIVWLARFMVARLGATTAVSCEATPSTPHASRRVCQSQAIEVRTHLDSPLTAGQATGLGAPLDLLLVTAARQHALVALRGQLVAHRRIVLRGPHVHRLPWVRVARRRVVLLHCVLRRGQRRAHLLLRRRWLVLLVVLLVRVLVLGLRRRRLLAVLQAYRRQIQRRQRHVCARRRPAVGLAGGRSWRRVAVRGLHRGGRRVRVRRGIGALLGRRRRRRRLLLLRLLRRRMLLSWRALRSRLLIRHAGLRKVRWGGRVGRGIHLRGYAGKIV